MFTKYNLTAQLFFLFVLLANKKISSTQISAHI